MKTQMICTNSTNAWRHAARSLAATAIMLILATGSSAASAEKLLYTFQGNGDGDQPIAGLTFDGAGNLYGGTPSGGLAGSCTLGGCGVLFKLTPTAQGQWQETVIYHFTGNVGDETGAGGLAPVVDNAGNLYLISEVGSANCGSVVKFAPSRSGDYTKTRIYNFKGGTDGCVGGTSLTFPPSLLMDQAGNLWGTTQLGGGGETDNFSCVNGCGTAFKLTPKPDGSWKETVVHRYPQRHGRDGVNPAIHQIDSKENLYGVTISGPCNGCAGLVFRLSPAKGGTFPETIIFQSHVSTNSMLMGGLLMDNSGNFFLTTAGTKCQSCAGGIVKLSLQSNGSYQATEIHVFNTAVNNDGILPNPSLAMDPAGNLYGTTEFGGGRGTEICRNALNGCGTVYKLTPAAAGQWAEQILFRFDLGLDGGFPMDDVLRLDPHGNIYGTTFEGGIDNNNGVFQGVVFRINQ